MPRLTYTDPETKELRYIRPENTNDDQFQVIDGWSSAAIRNIANQSSWTDDDKTKLRELMFRTAPGDIKGVVERATIETIVKWARDGGFYFSRITPQMDENLCAPSGDEKFGQMPPELAVAKHRRYPHVLDIHRGTDPQLPSGKKWIPMLRDVIGHGQSLQKGVRDRVDVIIRRGKITTNDPPSLYEIIRGDEFDDFYSFIRQAGIPHRKNGNYLTIPLLTLEQWAEVNSLILTPDTKSPGCATEKDRRSLMNIEGVMSFTNVMNELESIFERVRSATIVGELKTAKADLNKLSKKVEPYREIYDKKETTQMIRVVDNINTLTNQRTQQLTQ